VKNSNIEVYLNFLSCFKKLKEELLFMFYVVLKILSSIFDIVF